MRTIGVAAMLLAGLILTLCTMDNLGADPSMVQAPTAIEQFKLRVPETSGNDQGQVSPLIQQAQTFALYLNPPSTSVSPREETGAVVAAGRPAAEITATQEIAGARPASYSPKFELHGISYYRADPNESMAMICEQGGARRWVRVGDHVGHLVVERIENACVVYRDGVQLQTMALASSEAITNFAQKTNNRSKILKPSSAISQNTPAPPPVRGMRQIPLSRVAAKLGRPSLEKTLPSQSRMEAQ